ncbi:MAG: hypothetical protein QOG05_4777, partial [Streptosporangiaceae bacterium]|nr:hypothetical protein [Streptosporangiaceae bacterium]
MAAACATLALPPVPAMRVAATGLCRARSLGLALRVAAGGTTAGDRCCADPGSETSVQAMNAIAAIPVAASAPRAG